MKRLVLMVLVLMLSGCVGDSVYGTYVNNGSVLKLDKSLYPYSSMYYYTANGSELVQSGDLEINENYVILNSAFGTSEVLLSIGKNLMDKNGEVWVKK